MRLAGSGRGSQVDVARRGQTVEHLPLVRREPLEAAALLRFCRDTVSVVDAHWDRARGLMVAEALRVVTVSDRQLWKLWEVGPIDAAAGALVALSQALRESSQV